MTGHVSGRGYAFTWIALVGLTSVTFGLSFYDLGAASVAVALAIASLKAGLVALFFMHLVEQRSSNRLAFLAGVTLLVVLVVLVSADVATRDGPPFGR